MKAIRHLSLAIAILLPAASLATEQEQLEQARRSLLNNQPEQAVEYIKEALLAAPDNTDLELLLANTYLSINRFADAEAHLLKLREANVPPELWVLSLGKAYLGQDNFHAVINHLPKIEQAEWYVLQGHAHLGLKESKAAEQNYQKALDYSSDDPEALLGLARASFQAGDRAEAKKLLANILADHPKHEAALIFSAELARRAGDIDLARAQFAEALNIDNDNYAARLGMTLSLLDSNSLQFSDSAAHLYKLAPTQSEAIYLHALGLVQTEKYAEADKLLADAEFNSQADNRSTMLRARLAYHNQDYDGAKSSLIKLLSAQPNNLLAHNFLNFISLRQKDTASVKNYLGNLLANSGANFQTFLLLASANILDDDLDAGLAYLQQAAHIMPGHPDAAEMLNLSLQQTNAETKMLPVRFAHPYLQLDLLKIYYLVEHQDFTAALKYARKLVDQQPASALAHNALGLVYAKMDDAVLAKNSLNQAQVLASNFNSAKINMAQLLVHERDFPGAQAIADKLMKEHSDYLGGYYLAADIALAQNNTDGAEKILLKAATIKQSDPEPAIRLVQLYLTENKLSDARQYAEHLATNHPRQPQVLHLLGGIYMLDKNYQGAVRTFNQLTKAYPNYAEAWVFEARALAASKQGPLALKAIERAVQLKPQLLSAQLLQVKLYNQNQQPAKALAVAKNIQRFAPKDATGYILAGDIYQQESKYDLAKAEYERALAKDPQPQWYWKLYQSELALRGDASALQVLEQGRAKFPDAEDLLQNLASEYMAYDMQAKAKEIFEQLLILQSDNILALNNLAIINLSNDPVHSLDLAKQAHQLAPQQQQVQDTYGWVLVHNHKLKSGLDNILAALKAAPNNPETNYHAAVAYFKLNDRSQAKRYLQQALAQPQNFPSKSQAHELLNKLDPNS